MKTAMQEIIERADAGINAHTAVMNSETCSNIEKNRHSHLLNVCEMFKSLASELLKKEKQQILAAYDGGKEQPAKSQLCPIDYYNETFKP